MADADDPIIEVLELVDPPAVGLVLPALKPGSACGLTPDAAYELALRLCNVADAVAAKLERKPGA